MKKALASARAGRRAARAGSASRRGAPKLRPGVAELRALAHPLRLRICELLAEEPRTTKQVAELLGQPPTRLYHHVNALERAGLLRLRETRPNRGTIEKWYETIAARLTLSESRRPARRDAVSRVSKSLVAAVLAQTRQELTAALEDGGGERPLAMRLVAVGPPARMAAIRRRLLALVRELRRDGTSAGAGAPRSRSPGSRASSAETRLDRWALTLTFAPTWPRTNKSK
jgi:DNA-binding transcriptional ArsR family regulator